MKNKYIELCNKARQESNKYYSNTDNEEDIIPDSEFDKLIEEIESMEKKDPSLLKLGISPKTELEYNEKLDNVSEKGDREVKMLSLENVRNPKDLLHKFQRMLKDMGISDIRIFLTPKIDGMSCEVLYRNNLLSNVSTRGSYLKGEDIISNFKFFVNEDNYPDKLFVLPKIDASIRGELFVTNENFIKINNILSKMGKKEYKMPRFAVAALMKMKLTDEDRANYSKLRGLVSFTSFDLNSHAECIESLSTIDEEFEWMNNNGFQSVQRYFYNLTGDDSKDISNLDKLLIEISHRHSKFIPTDGVVIKPTTKISIKQKLANQNINNKFPKFAFCYKFPVSCKKTVLREIEYSMGKHYITPVAIFDDVQLDGSNVNRATLHNFDWVRRMNIEVGDTIVVGLADGIVPKIYGGDPTKTKVKTNYMTKIVCPACHTKCDSTTNPDSGIDLHFCPNPTCYGINSKKIFFMLNTILDIKKKGLGKESIEKICKTRFCSDFYDFPSIKKNRNQILASVHGIGADRLDYTIDELNRIFNEPFPLSEFIKLLSINGIYSTANKLMDFIKKDTKFSYLSVPDFMLYFSNLSKDHNRWMEFSEFIGDANSSSLVSFFNTKINHNKVLELDEKIKKHFNKDFVLTLQIEKDTSKIDRLDKLNNNIFSKYKGKLVSVTGSIHGISRGEFLNLFDNGKEVYNNKVDVIFVGSSGKEHKVDKCINAEVIRDFKFISE